MHPFTPRCTCRESTHSVWVQISRDGIKRAQLCYVRWVCLKVGYPENCLLSFSSPKPPSKPGTTQKQSTDPYLGEDPGGASRPFETPAACQDLELVDEAKVLGLAFSRLCASEGVSRVRFFFMPDSGLLREIIKTVVYVVWASVQ